MIAEESLRSALDRLAVADDVVGGARDRERHAEGDGAFIADVLGPLAPGHGRLQWIEMTPPNVARGSQLLNLGSEAGP